MLVARWQKKRPKLARIRPNMIFYLSWSSRRRSHRLGRTQTNPQDVNEECGACKRLQAVCPATRGMGLLENCNQVSLIHSITVWGGRHVLFKTLSCPALSSHASWMLAPSMKSSTTLFGSS